MAEQPVTSLTSGQAREGSGAESQIAAGAATTETTSAIALGQAAAPEPLVVTQPATGQTQEITLEAGQPVLLTMAAEDTFIAVDGANFVLSFDGDGNGAIDTRVVFLNLVDQAASDTPPVFVIGGQVVGSGLLVSQTIALGGGNGEPIPFETAAPQAPEGGGNNVYDDNLGDAIDLLAAQGVIPPTALVFGLPDPEPGEALDLTSDVPTPVIPPVEPPSDSLQANPDASDVRPNRSGDANAPETSVTIDVLANDVDSDGDPLTITSVTLDDPAQGTVSIVNNEVVFTPAVGVTVTTVGLTYEIEDPDGNTDSSTAQITIGQDNSVQRIVSVPDSDPNRTELLSTVDTQLVDVDGPNGTDTDPSTVNVNLFPNSDVTFTVTADPEAPDVLDLYLLQDLSGSFRDDLPIVRGEQSANNDAADLGLLDDLVTGVEAITSDVQFGLGAFRDIGPGGGSAPGSQFDFQHLLNLEAGQGGQRLDGDPAVPPPANPNLPPNPGEAYDELFAGNPGPGPTGLGGDFPERQLVALNQVALDAAAAEDGNGGTASQFGFRTGSSKVVVIITDATSKDWDNAVFRAELKANLQASGVIPIFLVAAGDEGEAFINNFYDGVIAELGVGARVPLELDSSNLVQAIEDGLNQITDSLTLSVADDDNDYVSIGAPTVDPVTGEHSWEVTLSAPLDEGHNNDPDIKLTVTNDSTTDQVGGQITVNVTTDAPESGGDDFDIVEGHNGQNVLTGGDGNDLIIGLGGDDLLIGGLGEDDFAFGARDLGAGVLDFDGNDIIQDFVKGEDQVNLDALFDALGIAEANRAGDVNVVVNGGNTEITVNGATDFMVTLSGVTDALTVGIDPDSDIVVV
ncbi:cadherin-like domain-containing protein [Pelagibius sp. Alg239-R121]|uniref:Ig-like domain-containing protein n=1 Tax=Pelagibius sp. Alg239-R121 TaxID=2993448 RepID=UPI0024A684C2|nr:cadherin-like domain-containing protein [Pelagibius sp. Alg239-R121]